MTSAETDQRGVALSARTRERVGGKKASLLQAKRQGAHVEEMQRRRLLLAIGELLADSGLEGASVGQIAKRAGVSRRTFYEIFDDREECFLAAFNQAIERISKEVAPAYARGRSTGAAHGGYAGERGHTGERGYAGELRWSARVRAAVTALLEHFDAHPGVARMCVVETLRAGPEVLERRRRVLSALVAAVDEGRDEVKHGAEPLPLSAEGVVGGALAVVHARLLEADHAPLSELASALTGMIIHPYVGPAAARRELERPARGAIRQVANGSRNPFKGLSIRFTYRTARVLATIADESGASNRTIAGRAGISDDGQMSRLLRRLQAAGLIENLGEGHTHGEPNAWWLTERGQAIHTTLAGVEATTQR